MVAVCNKQGNEIKAPLPLNTRGWGPMLLFCLYAYPYGFTILGHPYTGLITITTCDSQVVP